MQETWVPSLGQKDSLEKGMATHSSILPGKSQGQRSLAEYSPWGLRVRYGWETNTHTHTHTEWPFSSPLRWFKSFSIDWSHMLLLIPRRSLHILNLSYLSDRYGANGFSKSGTCLFFLLLMSFPPLFFFFDHIGSACGNLVPPPGIRPGPEALDAWSLNY